MQAPIINTSDDLETLMMGSSTCVDELRLSGSEYLDQLKDLKIELNQPMQVLEPPTLEKDAEGKLLEFDYTLQRLKKELLSDSEDEDYIVIRNYELKKNVENVMNDVQLTQFSCKQSHSEIGNQTAMELKTRTKIKQKKRVTTRLLQNTKFSNIQFPHEIKCSYCNAIFTDVCLLDRHLRAHIGMRDGKSKCVRRPYQCHFCGKRMNTTQVLEKHLARFHAGNVNAPSENLRSDSPESVECAICSEMVHIKNLTSHTNAHNPNDGRRFQCEQCFRSYKQKQTLRVHMKRHHANFFNMLTGTKTRSGIHV